jgi:formylglycine-generating enzyme required for sulfatase activity
MKLPNAWGLYDMHGNVSEYVQDWYYVCKAPTLGPLDGFAPAARALGDPPGCPRSVRMLRGGSYADPPELSRSARRIGVVDYSDQHWGLRLVRAE